jgi:hypothetical protein
MINGLFVFNRCRSFRQKKVRGVDRRARQILTKAQNWQVELDSKTFGDWDHWHFDWDGIGDFSPRIRLITMAAHACIFEALAVEIAKIGGPFQLFFSLARRDAGQDAVYLCAPNPHSSFPALFDDVEWCVPDLAAQLSVFLPQYQFHVGKRDFNYVAYAIGIGVPLAPPSSA